MSDDNLITAAQISEQLRRTGHVSLAARDYLITEAIQCPSNATLEGQGYSTRIICTGDYPAITLALETARPTAVTIRNMRLTRTNTLGAIATQGNSDGIRVWGTDITIEDIWTEDMYKHINVVPNLGSLSQNLLFRRIRSSNGAPTVYNSHSGIYLGDADRVSIEQWPQGMSYNSWYYPDSGETVTNVFGTARLYSYVAPAASSANGVHAAFAGNNASLPFPGPITSPAIPRTITATFGGAWDGGDITVVGTDQFDVVRANVLVANPGGSRESTVTFKTVTSLTKGAVGASANTVTIGWGNYLGILGQLVDTTGILAADTTIEAGTFNYDTNRFTPTTAPNGAHGYGIVVNVMP